MPSFRDTPDRSFARRHPVWTGVVATLALLVIAVAVLAANPQWLRGTVQDAVATRLHRDFMIGDLSLRWRGGPLVELSDVALGNLPGGSEPWMARIGSLQVSFAPLELLRGRVYLPRIAVGDADVLLERLADGRENWALTGTAEPKRDEAPSRVRIGAVSVSQGRVRYVDRVMPMNVTVRARPLDRQADVLSRRTDSTPLNDRYATVFEIGGDYRGNPFKGAARSGNVVSLQDSGVPFPLRVDLVAGETKIEVEGTVADAAQLSGIDVQLHISGPTLANIYPFLLLPLPASPPYALHGRLRRDGGRFAIDDLGGRIGETDLEGHGSYVVREPRPLLTVELRSQLLDMGDLGPLIGIETKSRTSRPDRTTQVATREQAKRSDARTRGERVLPAGRFDPERLRAIDADFRLAAHRVKGIASIPLEDFDGVVRLRDAVLKLDALKLGAAGGTLTARATLDARKGDALHSQVQAELRRLNLDQLLPKKAALAKGAGLVNATATLAGSGNSIADAAAKADGRIAAVMTEGRISNLLDAASGLALGRVLALLATGDREIKLNCGATVFDVDNGQGRSSMFVLDTAQTQVLGSGTFDLEKERFALHVEPKPKVKGLLSLRTPIDVNGSFSRAKVSLEKKPLLARAGAALALAAIAPPAALLALIEPGTGEDTPCASVLREAGAKVNQAANDKPAAADAR